MQFSIMIRIFFTALFLSAIYGLQAQTTATGYVYEDSNGNGKKERREKGLPNVAVSNGQDVVLTNKDGRYELAVGQDNPLFVIKPSGYKTVVNENNLPQYFYIHKPDGSPQDLKYAGVAATGKLPKSVDFALVPAQENDNFTALLFGDPQPYTEKEVDYFARGIVTEVEGIEDVVFGLSLGDLVGNNLDLFIPYIKAVQKVGVPWYNVMGNHDMNFDVDADSLSDETYEAHFGPANYAFNYGKVHFIILDDILYPDPRDGKEYWGGFRKDQLEFIENDLKHVPRDHLIVLAFHIPLSNSFRDEDRQQLFKLLKDFPNTLSLSAHTHMQRQDFFTKEDGWQQEKPHHHYNVGTTSGSWYGGQLDDNGIPISTMRDGTPKGYAFINFDGNDYKINYKAAGYAADYQMNIFAPKVVPHNEKTSAGIYVNFFMGREGDEVIYRVDDGEWKNLHFQNEPDPHYLHLLHEWDFAEELMPGKRLPSARSSTHLWRAGIPTNLRPGKHIIEVKATDIFGNTYTQKSSYRIEKSKNINQ
jgi:hypothetical protein